jgi:hypothetical protein
VISAITKIALRASNELDNVLVGPNPFRPDLPGSPGFITFANLTSDATITVYNILGKIATTLSVKDGNGRAYWDTTDQGVKVPSGLYLCRIENSQGHSKILKLFIIR